jgi:hypothetical protein
MKSAVEETKPITILYAAFCGTGKTYICNNTDIKSIEVEYWQYKEKGLQKEYVQDVKKLIGKVDYIFISTDPEGLRLLNEEGFDITLVYPKNELRNEYLDRYIDRDSSYDFIGTFMKHWNLWINELKEQKYCKHIILDSGQYLKDIINIKTTTIKE